MNSLLHFLRFAVGADQQFSQLTADETALLLSHVDKAEVFVELGCYEGKTACAVARRGVPSVYSVDPFTPGRLQICYGEWIARIQRYRDKTRNLMFLKGFSWDVAPTFKRDIDVLFIDADHQYESIRRDWYQWSPKVRCGGIIAMHDARLASCSPAHLGSQHFYEQDISRMTAVREIAAVDSLVVLQIIEELKGCNDLGASPS